MPLRGDRRPTTTRVEPGAGRGRRPAHPGRARASPSGAGPATPLYTTRARLRSAGTTSTSAASDAWLLTTRTRGECGRQASAVRTGRPAVSSASCTWHTVGTRALPGGGQPRGDRQGVDDDDVGAGRREVGADLAVGAKGVTGIPGEAPRAQRGPAQHGEGVDLDVRARPSRRRRTRGPSCGKVDPHRPTAGRRGPARSGRAGGRTRRARPTDGPRPPGALGRWRPVVGRGTPAFCRATRAVRPEAVDLMGPAGAGRHEPPRAPG